MKRSKIITLEGLTVDLAQIKAIRINMKPNITDRTKLIIDLVARYEFIFNPEENKYVKVRIDDCVEMVYLDYNSAFFNMESWQQEWQDYLDANNNYEATT